MIISRTTYLIALVLGLLISASPTQANPLDRWHWGEPSPTGYRLHAVAYGNGRFVAAGEHGGIISSADGQKWEPGTGFTPTQGGNINAVTFGNGVFVAVGADRILSSADGRSWTVRFEHVPDGGEEGLDYVDYMVFEDVLYANGRFTVVDHRDLAGHWRPLRRIPKMFTSSSGITWAAHDLEFEIGTLAFGKGLYVASGAWGIHTSADAVTWQKRHPSQANKIIFADDA